MSHLNGGNREASAMRIQSEREARSKTRHATLLMYNACLTCKDNAAAAKHCILLEATKTPDAHLLHANGKLYESKSEQEML